MYFGREGSLFCLGFVGFVFLKRHRGGKGERWRGMLAPWAWEAPPFLWVGKAASLSFPSPALFLGSGPTGQPPPCFSDRKEMQTACNHSKRLRFHQAVPVSVTVFFSFCRSQRPKCVFFGNYLRSSVMICHPITGVCFLPSPSYHGSDACPATMTLSLQFIIAVSG